VLDPFDVGVAGLGDQLRKRRQQSLLVHARRCCEKTSTNSTFCCDIAYSDRLTPSRAAATLG
jgi:hypothetical protein